MESMSQCATKISGTPSRAACDIVPYNGIS